MEELLFNPIGIGSKHNFYIKIPMKNDDEQNSPKRLKTKRLTDETAPRYLSLMYCPIFRGFRFLRRKNFVKFRCHAIEKHRVEGQQSAILNDLVYSDVGYAHIVQ